MNIHLSGFLLLTISIWSCGQKTDSTQVSVGRITESVYASGVVKSRNQYQVYSTVAGLVSQVLVKEGDVVKKGDPLMVVQSEMARLQAENARLSADFADLNTRGDRLRELQDAIETANARMLNDSLLLVRQQGLWAQQIGSKVELEQRELAYTNSKTARNAAIYRYRDLEKQLRFAADQSRKQLSISQQNMQDFVIRSQIDGKVYSLNKSVGEIVNSQMPLATIGSADVFLVELQIDEKDIAQIKTGQKALLTMDSYREQSFEAVIAAINPMMNERTRTFTAEATFVLQPRVLYPFLTTEANILLMTKDQVLTIPRDYLIADSLVYVEPDRMQRVKTGLSDYSTVEITDGLTAGQTIYRPGGM